MKYRGFALKPVERRFPPHNLAVKGIGIFRENQCLTYAHDYDLARRVVDDRLKRGIWMMEVKEDGEKSGCVADPNK